MSIFHQIYLKIVELVLEVKKILGIIPNIRDFLNYLRYVDCDGDWNCYDEQGYNSYINYDGELIKTDVGAITEVVVLRSMRGYCTKNK